MRRVSTSLIAALLACACAFPATGSAAAGAAEPSCAEGPATEGGVIEGTPCADTIVVPASVRRVDGGAGNDTIRAAPISSAACNGLCEGGVGSQVLEGGAGDDLIFGQRGNDTLRGGAGNDHLFGGIGDDKLEGGEGDDFLYGGFGADAIDGQEGSDLVRGDGTVDKPLRDTGATGIDTLSYATGITPGFANQNQGFAYPNFDEYAGLPSTSGERGLFLDLNQGHANNGIAAAGGGIDVIEGGFERIVGSPFSDYIVGTTAAEQIYGGGGGDVIIGGGGADVLRGGADGDDIDGGGSAVAVDGGPGANSCQNAPGAINCPGTSKAVVPRKTSQVSVGEMTPTGEQGGSSQIYLVGSSAGDTIGATYKVSSVELTIGGAGFDAESALNGCEIVTPSTASCALSTPLDAIVLAGMGGNDTIAATGFPNTVSPILIGGEGADTLTGGEASEDVLVDGAGGGEDRLSALGGDDALLHNGGPDELRGGNGNDLFLSVSICDAEHLFGEAGVDNSSWARLAGSVAGRLDLGVAGEVGAGNAASCAGGPPELDSLNGIEDLEGSEGSDVLFGDGANNQLLGHDGADTYFALGGNDSILANSEDSDPVIDCGEGTGDSAVIDIPHPGQYEDAAPVNCESIRQGAPNEFETITELPPVVVPPPPPPPPRDRTPPRTRLTRGPAKLITIAGNRHRVVFRFTSSERGSHFRCKLDGKPFRNCRSPRAYTVGLGAHAVRIVAVDAAGNADRTPALFRFRVRHR